MARKITLKVTPENIWEVIRKHSYSTKGLQALCELIDNAFTAIIERRKANPTYRGKIMLNIDFEKCVASIEDNGTGFPNDNEILSNAWSYGIPNPHGLSEHGCGIKSALSIFDATGTLWKCYWRNGDGKIYLIKPPYQTELEIHEVEVWPGKEQDATTGVYIEFPFPDECTRSLYSSEAKVKKDVGKRLHSLLSQMYMDLTEFKSQNISLFLNGHLVEPFRFSEDDISEKREDTITLSSGAKVHLRMIGIEKEIKGSWFKKTIGSVGIYISKNGRHIQHVSTGELFKKIADRASHPTFAGKFVLMSMTGEQNQLPATDPTKSCVNDTDPLFEELCEKARPIISAFYRNDEISVHERDLLLEFSEMRRKNLSNIIPGYSNEVNTRFEYKTPPIDMMERLTTGYTVYEAKRDNVASWPAILELYGNWRLVKHISHDIPVPKAVLLINANPKDNVLTEETLSYVQILKDNTEGFPFEIMNYSGDILWNEFTSTVAVKPKKTKSKKDSIILT